MTLANLLRPVSAAAQPDLPGVEVTLVVDGRPGAAEPSVPAPHAVPAPGGSLPFTGLQVDVAVVLAVVALVLGVLLRTLGRRLHAPARVTSPLRTDSQRTAL